MDQSFERSFVAQCAPTLAGVKPANLFRFQSKEPQMIYITAAYWNQQLSRKGIRVCVLKSFAQTQSFLIMAYRKNWIEKILCQQETRRFLKDLGYLMWEHCESFLQQLSERLCMEQEFPHEVGVFFGLSPL